MMGEAVLILVVFAVSLVIGHGAGVETERRRLRFLARRSTPRDLVTLERLIDLDHRIRSTRRRSIIERSRNR